jgi:hypothetical protein
MALTEIDLPERCLSLPNTDTGILRAELFGEFRERRRFQPSPRNSMTEPRSNETMSARCSSTNSSTFIRSRFR